MRLNTNLKLLSRTQIRRIKHLAKIWCVKTFGKNSRVKYPLRTRCIFRYGASRGEFSYLGEKVIFVYPNILIDVKELIEVFLHEYRHYLQPIKHPSGKKYVYSKDPQERQADRFANKYVRKCWTEIKDLI